MHIATCPLCEAACGILVDVEGGQVRSIRGDPDDPFSGGYICPKASALADVHHDPDRLRAPMVREGSRWRETSWDEALDVAADGLIRARRQHGRDAVAIYYGNPVAHNLGLMTHALPFARALRTKNVYSASSADQLPQMPVALRMFGHLALIPVPDLERHLDEAGGMMLTTPAVDVVAVLSRAGGAASVWLSVSRGPAAAAPCWMDPLWDAGPASDVPGCRSASPPH